MSDLERALTVHPDDGCWTVTADPGYESISGMFGGWTAAVALRAVLQSTESDATPAAITTNFVGKIEPGSDVRIRTRQVGGSRSVEHWVAEVQCADGDSMLAFAAVVLARRRDSDGHVEAVMPAAPAPASLPLVHPPGPEGERVDVRPIEGNPPFNQSSTFSTTWLRETSGRPIDRLQLVFLADQFAPRSFFWSDGPRPSSTLSMSVYLLATEDEIVAVGDDYVLAEGIGSRGAQSTSAQHGRLWSRSGVLLATTEQLCWYR